jgi:hypothetical protein
MTEAEQISAENSKKLDEVLLILKGQGEAAPGLMAIVHAHSVALYGVNGKLGLSQKVETMWRFSVWVLAAASATGGYLLKAWVH